MAKRSHIEIGRQPVVDLIHVDLEGLVHHGARSGDGVRIGPALHLVQFDVDVLVGQTLLDREDVVQPMLEFVGDTELFDRRIVIARFADKQTARDEPAGGSGKHRSRKGSGCSTVNFGSYCQEARTVKLVSSFGRQVKDGAR